MIFYISPTRLEHMLRARWLLPAVLLDEIARQSEFAAALRANVGVRQSFTLRTHTLRVMDCYEKFFAQLPEVDARTRGLFRVFLALHDIGKPKAIEAGDKRFQHRFTVQMMRRTRKSYPVTDREFDDWIALVDGDPLGGFLKGEMTLAETKSEIRRMGAQSSLPPEVFFKQLIRYYQCDVSAYTTRAGLMDSLDELFEWTPRHDELVFEPAVGILKFSERIRIQMTELTPLSIWGKAW